MLRYSLLRHSESEFLFTKFVEPTASLGLQNTTHIGTSSHTDVLTAQYLQHSTYSAVFTAQYLQALFRLRDKKDKEVT